MSVVRLSDEVLSKLEAVCQQRSFRHGEEITVKGERHKSMFFILAGWVEVKFLDGRNEQHSLRVGERSALGEMSFLSGKDAVATAVAVGSVTVLEVDKPTLDTLAETDPDAADEFRRYITATMDRRLQS